MPARSGDGRPNRDRSAFDVVIYGATSFVGQILCRYFVERHGTDGELRWAIAGRNRDKLDQVASESGADVPRIVADAADDEALRSLAESTEVVVSTVGPYALYGSKLIAAVVEAGVGYCDLTGEPQWMSKMIDMHHDRAVETGARVVHACGFDSVPSDLGVWFLQREALARFGAPCSSVRMGVQGAKGGFSGGTAASMMNLFEETSRDPSLRHVMTNPYVLAPEGERHGVDQPNVTWPEHSDEMNSWTAAFVMAPTNTRVVLRTHALAGRPWGDHFTYGEAMMTGDGVAGRAKAYALSAAMAGFMGAAGIGPVRSLLGRALPAPGEGPSLDKQRAGYYHLRFHGRTDAGDTITTRVTGDQDPGYGSTSKILGEAACCLLERSHDADRSGGGSGGVGGGFWTPATALGDGFIVALTEQAGLTFDVLS
jgi:short subunit dehydrogenase-like uncharacterized protein